MTMNGARMFAAIVVLGSLGACQSSQNSGRDGRGSGQAPPHAPEHGPAHSPAHWGYEGEIAPASWDRLSPDYALCAEGQCQSPIDIVQPQGRSLANVVFDYQPSGIHIVNNGHSVQVNYDSGSYSIIEGKRFPLAQFHFHSPSEHRVAGRAFAAEMHLVHKADDGELAVVAVLIAEGRENPAFGPVWSQMPATAGPERTVSGQVNAADLLPAQRTSFRYGGSLTSPPCSEKVRWVVMATPIEMSSAQIAAFRQLHNNNNRPIQPLNSRMVVEDTSP